MTLQIRRGAQLGFIAAVLAGLLAPVPAAAQSVLGGLSGPFSYSLAEGWVTGSGEHGHLTFVGRTSWEMSLALAPAPGEPLSRDATGAPG